MGSKKLPASTGGIVQYFEDAGSKTKLNPKQVIILSVVLILIVLLLRFTNILAL